VLNVAGCSSRRLGGKASIGRRGKAARIDPLQRPKAFAVQM
jgi:hypothetical protein